MQETKDALIDKVIGRHYKIVELIGEGGMSRVYKALHLLLNKQVAIKFIHPKFVYDQKSVRRFQQEAQAAASLKHPNICSVTEFGIDDEGHTFLVMDFVHGQSLSELLLSKGPCPPPMAIDIISPICEALAHAHSKGVIHRDLKPGNIVFAQNAENQTCVQLVDFGIAKLVDQDDDNRPNLTKTGEVLGTPSYMSPEQCLGKKVDNRSDIYSIGCVLYELVSGVPPFSSEHTLGVLLAHVNEPIPRLSQNVAASGLQSIIDRCLDKEPEKRYQDAKQMVAELQTLKAGPPRATIPPPPPPPTQAPVTAVDTRPWQESGNIADRYQIVEQIGQGGMGTVLKARHLSLNKFVAIKILNPGKHLDDLSMKRFEVEAQASSKLSHPNLVSVFDYGFTTQKEPYLVMEYIEGECLDAILEKNGKLQLNDFLEYFTQLCKALNYIHKTGIIHRDIKTSNIIVQNIEGDRYVKILDLGIAKVLSSDSETPQQHLTATGTIFGSPLYMSPEQCLGKEADQRSDIYSLGVVMYECFTGLPPLFGDTALHTLHKQISEVPQKIKVSDGSKVDAGIVAIIEKCLEKQADKRFQQASDLLAALNAVSSNSAAAGGASVHPPAAAGAGQRDKFLDALHGGRNAKASPAGGASAGENSSANPEPAGEHATSTTSGAPPQGSRGTGVAGTSPGIPNSNRAWHERAASSSATNPKNQQREVLDSSVAEVQVAALNTVKESLQLFGGLLGAVGNKISGKKETVRAEKAPVPWFLNPARVLAILLLWCVISSVAMTAYSIFSGQFQRAVNNASTAAESTTERSKAIQEELNRLSQPR